MAITAAKKTTDFSGFLPATITAPVFERARQTSVMMQLAREIPLGLNGNSIPVVTALPVADWVAEGATKPATVGTMALRTMTPQKLAAIMVNSEEVVRQDPGGYINRMFDDLGEAFARAFDYATLHNLGGGGTGTGPFSTYIDQTTKANELGAATQANGGLHTDLVESLAEIVSQNDVTSARPYDITGWALDTQMEPELLRSVDTTGRPLWVELPSDTFAPGLARRGSLLGRPSIMSPRVRNANSTILGYGGDWSQAVWGQVGGIEYSVSNESSVTINGSLVSLWENNLVAIRAEAWYGFVVNDKNAFIQLRNDSGS